MAALPRGARRAAARSSSSSRTCTGPTTACSTSSTTSSTGRAERPAPRRLHGPARAARRAGPAGAAASRTRSRSRSRRSSDDETARLVHALLERAVLPAEMQRRCSSAPAATRSTPSSSSGCSPIERGASDAGDLPLPETLQGLIAARLDGLSGRREGARSRTQRWSARSSGSAGLRLGGRRAPARSRRRSTSLERKEFVRRERRSSVDGRDASTRSATCSCATSPTGRSRVLERAEKHRPPPSGSSRSDAPRTTPRCSRITTWRARARRSRRRRHAALCRASARAALREAGDRAIVAQRASAPRQRFYRAALDLVARKTTPSGRALRFSWRTRPRRFVHSTSKRSVKSWPGFSPPGNVEDAAEVEAYIAASAAGSGRTVTSQTSTSTGRVPLSPTPRCPRQRYASSPSVRGSTCCDRRRRGRDPGGAGGASHGGAAGPRRRSRRPSEHRRRRRAGVGDDSGLADLEQSPGDWPRAQPRDAVHRTYNNLMECYRKRRRLEESAEVLAAERRADERFGLRQALRWVSAKKRWTGTGAAIGKRRSLAWTNSWPKSRQDRLTTRSRHADGCASI